jgi:hypothetical protein
MAGEKLITVIVPQGEGLALLQALYARGVLRAALATARAPFTYVARRFGMGHTVHHSVEKDVLSVVVAGGESEEVFAFLHQEAGIAQRPGGFLFMGPLHGAGSFALPASGELAVAAAPGSSAAG